MCYPAFYKLEDYLGFLHSQDRFSWNFLGCRIKSLFKEKKNRRRISFQKPTNTVASPFLLGNFIKKYYSFQL